MNHREVHYRPLDVVIRYGLDVQRDAWSIRIDDTDNWNWQTNQRPPIYANESNVLTTDEFHDVVNHVLKYARGTPDHREPLSQLLRCAVCMQDV